MLSCFSLQRNNFFYIDQSYYQANAIEQKCKRFKLRNSRHRIGSGGRREGLPLHHRLAREDERREGRRLASARSRNRAHAHIRDLRLAGKSHLSRTATQQPAPQLNHFGPSKY